MSSLKQDLIAGFSVFLLALPLCLGIALASHFPPAAGIITAIIGGIFTSLLGGARLTIKGPAAGLIVIVVGSVVELGQGDLFLGYQRTLAVGVIAALIQIFISLRKKAGIVESIPPSIIHGMLAAIGVIIITKQFYVLIGSKPMAHTIVGLLTDIPMQINNINPIVFAIGLCALFIVILWPKLKALSFIPSSIIVIAITVPLSIYFDIHDKHTYHLFYNDYILDSSMLVNLPQNLIHAIQFPDFSYLYSFTSAKYIILFTLVGSIESLLSVCAIDSMVKDSKPTDLNKDLLTVGIGNLFVSLIGGLPMIAEIVRSRANIEYGAKSRKANFFHGLFMLIAALLFTPYINLIPLSALAALLIYVGYKLASPKLFIHTYEVGLDQFALFMTTFMVTISVDLLAGVVAGLMLKLLIQVYHGNSLKQIVFPEITLEQTPEGSKISISGPLTFVAYSKLKNLIKDTLLSKNPVIVDLSKTMFIDHTIMSKLESLRDISSDSLLIIANEEHLQPLYNHALATRKCWA